VPDSPFIGPSYNLDSRPASVQRTVNLMPVPNEPGNERAGWVFRDVPGLVAVDQTVIVPEVPPEGPPVISQLDFHDAQTASPYLGGSPNIATTAVTEDYIPGVTWNLIGHETAVVTKGAGIMTLPEYAASDGGSSNGVLFSGEIAGFAACDDFTLELSHDENGVIIYGTVAFAMIAGGCFSTPSTGPSTVGEWALLSRQNSGTLRRYLTFSTVHLVSGTPTVTSVDTQAASYDVPHGAGTVREIAVTRTSGILRIFINGVLRGTQNTGAFPVDHQALVPYVTMGGGSDGLYYIPNNYAGGKYSRWRLTAESLYTTDYTPTGLPFPPP
jgi:hypothetical protein